MQTPATNLHVTTELRDLVKVAAALEGESVLNFTSRVLVPVLTAYVRERAAYLSTHGQLRISRRSAHTLARIQSGG